MTKLLVLGAGGQIALEVVHFLKGRDDIQATLFLRDASRLGGEAANLGMRIIEGDAGDRDALAAAMAGQDIVYANLSGEIDTLAAVIVEVMQKTAVKRLIFVNTLGIYDEIPGAFGEFTKGLLSPYLPAYRLAADVIEASDLDYTILRPSWLTDYDEVDYETSRKGEPIDGTEVSRKSVAAFIVQIIEQPNIALGENLGMQKPGTQGEKPTFL